jgi:putative redox protein
MTLQMYARHKSLPLQHVTTEVRHSKLKKDPADAKATVSVFERAIEITGELDAAQRKRLIEIAERCPVHRTLKGEVQIETRERVKSGRG